MKEEKRLRNAICCKAIEIEKLLENINLKTGYGFQIIIETKRREKGCRATTTTIWAYKLDK